MAKRRKLTRSEIVSRILRSLAIEVDPITGHLTKLAEFIDKHPVTLSGYIKQGYVPEDVVKCLQKKFGESAVRMDELCPAQFRR
jgi:hypothetical protein